MNGWWSLIIVAVSFNFPLVAGVVAAADAENVKGLNGLLSPSAAIMKNPMDAKDNQKRLGDFTEAALEMGVLEKQEVKTFTASAKRLIAFVSSKGTWQSETRKTLGDALTKRLSGGIAVDSQTLGKPLVSLKADGSIETTTKVMQEAKENASIRLTEQESKELAALWDNLLDSYSGMASFLRAGYLKEQIPGGWIWLWRPVGRSAKFSFTFEKAGTWTADVEYFGDWPLIWSAFTTMKGTWAVSEVNGESRLTVELTNVKKLG